MAELEENTVLKVLEKIQSTREAMKERHKNACHDGCQVVKIQTLRSLRVEAPTLRMRNFPKPPGRKMGVKYDVRETEDTGVTGVVQATGPWHILEFGVGPHSIHPKRVGRAKFKSGAEGGLAAINWPGADHPVMSANHPGITRRAPWTVGVALARPLVPKAYMAAMVGTLMDAWYH